jgi:H+/gluconate symporter-like permease
VPGIKKSPATTTSVAPPSDSTQVPPVTSFGTAAETSPNTVVPHTPSLAANKSMSSSLSFFFILIVITAILLITLRWWKKTKKKPRSVIDYSSASSEELIELITTGTSLASIPIIVPKVEPLPKSKGNFEIRV